MTTLLMMCLHGSYSTCSLESDNNVTNKAAAIFNSLIFGLPTTGGETTQWIYNYMPACFIHFK